MAERYRLNHRVATGGMAEVYLGVAQGAEGFEKPVAVKRVHPHLANDPQIARMFLAEARVARHLHHQNIVEVLDVGKSPDGLYLVMELVDGWSLAEILDRGIERGVTMPPPLAGFVASQVMAGLTHAYRRTDAGKRLLVAHRDVSPSNVLVSREGEVKVADFGIAKLETISTATEPGTFKGKVDYASPEVLAGQPASEASDQFALGVVLFEMLAGRHPFGSSQSLMTYVQALSTQPPPPLPPHCGSLADVTLKLLSKAPADRFAWDEDVSRALGDYLARCGVATSSRELARYVESLDMPPSFARRPSLAGAQGTGSFSIADNGSEILKKAPVSPVPGPGPLPAPPRPDFELDPAWEPQGPTLDASGAMVRSSPIVAAPPPPARVPSALELDLPMGGMPDGYEPGLGGYTPRFADSALPRPRPQTDVAPGDGRAALSEGYVPLGEQLNQVAPARRRSRIGLFAATSLLLIGLALGTVFFVFPSSQRWLKLLGLPTSPKPTLYIDSEPPGATVTVNGQELGETPVVQDNLYPAGMKIDFELRLKGHRPAKGTFPGGEPAERHLELKRR